MTPKNLKNRLGELEIRGRIDGLVSLFNGISTLFRLFNAKAILLEELYYLTHSWDDKGVHTFPKGICPKVNIIARLENKLAYYDSTVHRFNHYTTRTPPGRIEIIQTTACSVMVIVTGNGHGDTSSNPRQRWLHFT